MLPLPPQVLEADVWVTVEGTQTVRLDVARLREVELSDTRRVKVHSQTQRSLTSVAGDMDWLGLGPGSGRKSSSSLGFTSPTMTRPS